MGIFSKTSKVEKIQAQTARVELAMAQEKLRQQRKNRSQVHTPIPETSQDHTRESIEEYRERIRRVRSGKR